MYIIFENVKKTYGEKDQKHQKIPVDKSANARDADKKVKTLNARLAKNKEIHDNIWSELFYKHNSNQELLDPKDKAIYRKLKLVNEITGYTREQMDAKHLEFSNPLDAASAEPPVEKKPRKKRKRKAKKVVKKIESSGSEPTKNNKKS